VTEEVLRMSLRQITIEMIAVMMRTSGNPVFTDSNDFSVQILVAITENCWKVRLSSPYHVGTSSSCLRH